MQRGIRNCTIIKLTWLPHWKAYSTRVNGQVLGLVRCKLPLPFRAPVGCCQRPEIDLVEEHLHPFAEAQIGGDDRRAALMAITEQIEKQLAAGAIEGHKAQLVTNQQVDAPVAHRGPRAARLAG